MSENIPALIAEARRFDTEPADYASRLLGAHDLIDCLADALESLSAPSGDDREALEEILFDENNYERVHFAGSFEDEFRPRKAAGAILAAGFRRPSPVTRENPVVSAIEDAKAEVAEGRRASVVVDIPDPVTREALGKVIREAFATDGWVVPPSIGLTAADAILSRFALPEPAEVEWEYGYSGMHASVCDSFTGDAEECNCNAREGKSGPDLRRTRGIEPGPWVPVEKGAEQ